MKLQGQQVPSHNLIKSPDDIKWIKKAAKINNEILDLVEKEIHAGMSTEDIDKMVYDYTVSHGAIPACLGMRDFLKVYVLQSIVKYVMGSQIKISF